MSRRALPLALLLFASPAAALERSDFAHGLSVEGAVGGIGFLTVGSDVIAPGPLFGINVGLDVFSWFSIRASFEGSTHETNAPPPPPRTTFQTYYPSAGGRLLVPLSLRLSILAQGEFGYAAFAPDLLETYGFPDATQFSPYFSASVGLDVHSWGRRLAWGIRGGYRHLTSLGDGAASGVLYLRHTF